MIPSAMSVDLPRNSMYQLSEIFWALSDAGYETDEASEGRELEERNGDL